MDSPLRSLKPDSTHNEQFFCPIWGETLLKYFLLLQNTNTISNFKFWFYLICTTTTTTIIQSVVHMLVARGCSCKCGCTLDGSVISIIVFLY